MYDLIIIGAGPAGLTAALYALRANKNILILEAKNYGGQIVNALKIENYPGLPNVSGFDYATAVYNQVKDLGAEIKFEKVIKIQKDKKVITSKNVYNAKAIIIATGVENRKLGLENEDTFIGRGISYCANCDGNFYKNKIVAVVGGGNTALTDAIYLSDIASKVYLIHRRDSFKAEYRYVNEIKNKTNIEVILNSNVVSLDGKDFLENIVIIDNNYEKINLEVNGLFIAIGHEPKNLFFEDLIKTDKSGYIESVDGVHTNIEGIYVAGDARVKDLRQLVTAISDGAISATTAINEMR